MDWTSGLGGVGGRGRASTHGAFSWIVGSEPDKKTDFEFSWGREGGGPGSGATEARDGLDFGLGRSEPDKKMILSFFGAGRGGTEEGVGGGGVVRSRAQGAEWWGSG